MADRPLKILIVPSWYFPAGSDVLAGRMFHQHALALREAGHDAAIWYAAYSPARMPWGGSGFRDEEGVPTWRAGGWALPRWTHGLTRHWIDRVSRRLAAHIEREGAPDVLHAQSFLAACVCARLQQRVKVPFVYTERSSRWVTRDLPLYLMPYIHQALRDAAALTCVSHGLRDRINVQTNRPIAVIPPHVDERIFNVIPDEPKPGQFTFVTAGEPAGIKGLDVLLDAFADFTRQKPRLGARLILADRIPEEKALKAQALRLGIEANVTFAGKLDQPALASLFRQSHAYISASRVETFGKAMAEAQACGLPIVATPTDGARDIVADSSLGIIAGGFDAPSLAAAITALAEGYASDSGEAIAAASVRFHRAPVMHQWTSLYQSVIA
jgi:glycosyltransferase involved in cell wall biosynthesis